MLCLLQEPTIQCLTQLLLYTIEFYKSTTILTFLKKNGGGWKNRTAILGLTIQCSAIELNPREGVTRLLVGTSRSRADLVGSWYLVLNSHLEAIHTWVTFATSTNSLPRQAMTVSWLSYQTSRCYRLKFNDIDKSANHHGARWMIRTSETIGTWFTVKRVWPLH